MKPEKTEESEAELTPRISLSDELPERITPRIKMRKIRLGSERAAAGPPPTAHPSIEVADDRLGNPSWRRRGRPKRIPGRPVKYANKFDMVRDCAMVGLTLEQIGFVLGFTPKKWQLRCAAEPGLAQAFKEGKVYGVQKISQVAYKKALKGDNFCIQLYLRCIAGWRETQKIEITDGRDPDELQPAFDLEQGRKVAEAYLRATDAVVVQKPEVKQIVSRETPQAILEEPGVRPQEMLPKDTKTERDGLTRPGVEEGVGVTIPPHEEN